MSEQRLGVLGEPPWHAPELRTRRLYLREPRLDDAPAILELYSNPAVMQYTDDDPYPDLDKARLRIDDWSRRAHQGRGVEWLLTLSECVVGAIGLHRISSQHRRAELGFELAPSYWRQGYMSEAVDVVLRCAFQKLALHKVQARTTGANQTTQAFLKALGFRAEGVQREQAFWKGQFHDLHLFGLLESDWAQGRAELSTERAAR